MAGALDRQVGSSDFSDPWSYLELERKANQQRVRPNELNVLPINLSTNSTVVSPGVEEGNVTNITSIDNVINFLNCLLYLNKSLFLNLK